MPSVRFRRFAVGALLLAVSAPVASATAQTALAARLTDKEIWQLNADFSEPNGYFRSDNFVSNETGFQFVIPELRRLVPEERVYLGVGPEQNFTYIAAL